MVTVFWRVKASTDLNPLDVSATGKREASPETRQESRKQELEDRYLVLTKGMSLSVCYSASIGGTATLTGSTTNIILKGQVDK